jgi:RAB protein geranylgeranyltransferase component A
MRNDIFKSLAIHIEGIQRMKQMEDINNGTQSIAVQYRCKKEELFEDMVFVLVQSNTDILNKLYAIILGRKAFKISPEMGLMPYLSSILSRNSLKRENSANTKGLIDFMDKLSEVFSKFDKLKELEKIFAGSDEIKITKRKKSSSDFEKLEAMMA